MSKAELTGLTLAEARDGLVAKDFSAVELAEAHVDAVEQIRSLNAYLVETPDAALEGAKLSDERISKGEARPLEGLPLGIKDLFCTKGVQAAAGSKILEGFKPPYESTVTSQLWRDGALMLGKLNMDEFAMGSANITSAFGPVESPWKRPGENRPLVPGGSSGGSAAAVSARAALAATGTDTGGSIRYPSMANGVVGLKPTYGAVSRYGVMELAQTLDHVGPLARSVEDVAILFDAISGRDALDPTSLQQDLAPIKDSLSLDVEGMTLGVDFNYIENGTDRGLLSAIDQVIETFKTLGVGIVELKMPRSDPQELRDLWLPITAFEAVKAHKETFPSRADDYGDYLREVLEHGLAMEEQDYLDAQTKRKEYATHFEAQLLKVDAVICPAGGFVFEVDAKTQYGDKKAMASVIKNFQGQFTIPSNLIGSPAIVVPCGFSDDKRPYTFQLLGPKVSEGKLCALGYKYEQQYEWNLRHPDF